MRPVRRCRLLRSQLGVKRTSLLALHMSAYDPKRTLDGTVIVRMQRGEPMHNFEAFDGQPERIGKVIGDTLAALVILYFLCSF